MVLKSNTILWKILSRKKYQVDKRRLSSTSKAKFNYAHSTFLETLYGFLALFISEIAKLEEGNIRRNSFNWITVCL